MSKGLNFSCVYWAEAQDGGVWSGKGCVKAVFNSTHVVCSWSHLSSFAVLMALYPFEVGTDFTGSGSRTYFVIMTLIDLSLSF